MEILIALLVLLSGGLVGTLFSFLHDVGGNQNLSEPTYQKETINLVKTSPMKFTSWRR
jgi:hypothetical protein